MNDINYTIRKVVVILFMTIAACHTVFAFKSWNGPYIYNASSIVRTIKIISGSEDIFSVKLDGGMSVTASGEGFDIEDATQLKKYSFTVISDHDCARIDTIEIIGQLSKNITKQIWMIDDKNVCSISERKYIKIILDKNIIENCEYIKKIQDQ